MKTHSLKQGTPEWHAHRRTHRNASDAPAMMGYGQKTRTELLTEVHTGIEREVSDYVQEKIFDPGHEFEALARPLAQEFLGKELYAITGSLAVEGINLPLSASYDGMDMMETIGFEHKRLNATLREAMFEGCTGADLPLMYQIQMEHQCIVGGLSEELFMASEWNGEELIEERHCIYKRNPELAAQILAGWAQFEADLVNYVPPEVTVKATGRMPENLPALRIELTGQVTTSNLAQYKEHALAVFEGINKDLKTDQDFADAEKTVKWCADIEDRLAAAKQHALSQTQSIDQLFSTIDEISAEARRVRLDLDKLIKAQKESIRNEIVFSRMALLKAHIADLNASIGKPLMPVINADIAGAMKGKRTVDTLRDAADTELAQTKIEATGIADRIKANLATLAEHQNLSTLFPDVQALVLKQPEDLAAMITARISVHEANEAARKAKETKELAEREAEAKRNAAAAANAGSAVHPNGAPMFSTTTFKDNGQPIMLDAQGQRSVFCDLNDDLPEPVNMGTPATLDEMHAIGEGVRNWPEPKDTGALIKLGDINARLAPIAITAAGLESLGFVHAVTDKAAKLYRKSDFPKICNELIKTINMAKNPQLSTA